MKFKVITGGQAIVLVAIHDLYPFTIRSFNIFLINILYVTVLHMFRYGKCVLLAVHFISYPSCKNDVVSLVAHEAIMSGAILAC